MQLASATFGVSDVDEWSSFASVILGAAVTTADDGSLDLGLDGGPARYRVVPGEDDLVALAWEAADEDEFERLAGSLARHGTPTSREGDPASPAGASRSLRFTDPYGTPSVLSVGRTPGHRDVEPEAQLGFVTGALGAGHLALRVRDPQPGIDFYTRALGFKLTDRIVFQAGVGAVTATFLRCNPRHHTLAIVGLPGERLLDHFMVERADLDDVGRVLDLAHAQGVEVRQELGRHSNDRMVSFYLRTPSGFEVEYGWGGRLIDDATHTPCDLHDISLWGHERHDDVIVRDLPSTRGR